MGLLFAAGPAAANDSVVAHLGDGMGARADATSDFADDPFPVALIRLAALIATAAFVSDDDL